MQTFQNILCFEIGGVNMYLEACIQLTYDFTFL